MPRIRPIGIAVQQWRSAGAEAIRRAALREAALRASRDCRFRAGALVPVYFDSRSFDSEVPIWAKAVPMPLAVVVAKKLPVSAQYFRTADSGSPSVLT